MPFTKDATEIFRLYVTDGVPASGPNPPNKQDVLTWAEEVQAEVGSTETSGVEAYHNPANGTFIVEPAGPVTPPTGLGLTGLGHEALEDVTTGNNNTAYGRGALSNLTTASQNSVFGSEAGLVVNGNNNSLFGYRAGLALTNGTENTAVGSVALGANTTGDQNSAFGFTALTANVTGNNNVAVGYGALAAYLGSESVAVGHNAMVAATGANNTALGTSAGGTITTGAGNIFIGYSAGSSVSQPFDASGAIVIGSASFGVSNSVVIGDSIGSTAQGQIRIGGTTFEELYMFGSVMMRKPGPAATYFMADAGNMAGVGTANIGFGDGCLRDLTTGSANVAIGYRALENQETANNCICIGAEAGTTGTAISDTVLIGSNAGNAMATAVGCVAIGQFALASATTGNNIVSIGDSSLRFGTSVDQCVAVGYKAGESIVGPNNTLIGTAVGLTRTAGSNNTGVGHSAFSAAAAGDIGDDNVAVGYLAANSITNAQSSIFIGKDSGNNASQIAAPTNSIAIGTGSYTDDSNQTVIGNNSTTWTVLHGDLYFNRDVASASGHIINGQSAATGTSNASGGGLVMRPGKGTGTGLGGSFSVEVSTEGGSGSTQNPYVNAFEIDRTKRCFVWGPVIFSPVIGASMTGNLTVNGQVAIEFASNTSIVIKARGSDGVVRASASITLS